MPTKQSVEFHYLLIIGNSRILAYTESTIYNVIYKGEELF